MAYAPKFSKKFPLSANTIDGRFYFSFKMFKLSMELIANDVVIMYMKTLRKISWSIA